MKFFSTPKRNSWIGVSMSLLIFSACHWKKNTESTSSQSVISLTKTTPESAQHDFRNIFYTYLKQANFPDERIQQEIFLNPDQLINEKKLLLGVTDPLAKLRDEFAKVRPSDLYSLGVKTPFQQVLNPESVFSRTGPITIVLVPGIFGEFIAKRPFEEVLDSGTFNSQFSQALRERTTQVYSLRALGKLPTPLSEAASIGSIDSATGNALVNLILLRPAFASLETLGTLESSVETYLKRLEEVFLAIPPNATKNIYFMGYSRGAAVALSLLSEAARSPQKNPWIQRVRGFVGLAGVYWGTELADDALDDSQKSPTAKAIGTINWLGNELRTTDNTAGLPGVLASAGAAGVIANNAAKWAQAVGEFANLQRRQQAEAPSAALLEAKHLNADSIDFMAMGNFLWNVSTENFNLKNATGEYNQNVLKFQKLVSEAMAGLRTLTTKENLERWKRTTLPSGLKMYSITASMPDASDATQTSPMLAFDAYGPKTADFVSSLRGSFHNLHALTRNQINDSQVTLYGSQYWPTMHRSLNPSQQPLQNYFLGTVGTHHWGLAFPIALKANNGEVNHFPRPVLLKSIGTYLALTQE